MKFQGFQPYVWRLVVLIQKVLDVAQVFNAPESVKKVLRVLIESMLQAANGETA